MALTPFPSPDAVGEGRDFCTLSRNRSPQLLSNLVPLRGKGANASPRVGERLGVGLQKRFSNTLIPAKLSAGGRVMDGGNERI